jgi:predicted nucleic acid-binding protein
MRVLFDSSALFKRYNLERGRDQVLAVGERATEMVVATHCKVEIASALNRQRHDGVLSDADYARVMAVVHEEFSDFTVVAFDQTVEAFSIAAMKQARLRAMDALHIGTAQVAKVALFVTADKRQAQAALSAGLNTELIEA